MSKFSVGQQLYFVPENRHQLPGFVTIKKAGRIWLELSNRYRVRVDTLCSDGGNARCYIEKETHDADIKLSTAFSRLKNGMSWVANPGVTVLDIEQAAALLKIELGGVK